MPRWRTSRIASGSEVFGVIVITGACMTSSTSIVRLLTPSGRSVSTAPASRRLRPLGTIERDSHRGLAKHLLGDAADERAADAAPSARRHRDEVGVPGLGLLQDLLDRVAVSNPELERDILEPDRGRVQVIDGFGFEPRRLLIGVDQDVAVVVRDAFRARGHVQQANGRTGAPRQRADRLDHALRLNRLVEWNQYALRHG